MSRILIVDDAPLIRDSVRSLLEASRHEVLEAEDGDVGLERLEGGDVDLCLVDVNMPRMSGLEMIRRARAQGFSGPMLVLTTESTRALRAKARAAGATGWLTKPADARTLDATIAHLAGGA